MNQLHKSVILFAIAWAMAAMGAGSAISAATALGDVGAGPFGVNGGSRLDSGTRLGPSDPGGADLFGSNVAIDGHLAVIGAADADNFLGAAAAGTAVTLTATPDAGFLFVNWSGARISNAPTCTVTVNANATVQANFAK